MLEKKKHQASGKDQLLVKPTLANASKPRLWLYVPAWLAAAQGLHPQVPSCEGDLCVYWAMTQLKPPKTHGGEATHPWVTWAGFLGGLSSGHQALPFGLRVAFVSCCQRIQQSKLLCLKKSVSPVSPDVPQSLKAGCHTEEENPQAASGSTFLLPVRASS